MAVIYLFCLFILVELYYYRYRLEAFTNAVLGKIESGIYTRCVEIYRFRLEVRFMYFLTKFEKLT